MKRSLLLCLAVTGLVFGQTESQITSPDVERVGKHIQCQCGSCKENLNCNMSAHQCHFCKPARTEIFKQQQQGKSDSDITAWFVKQYGQAIQLADPNSSFWLVPYFSLAAGGVLVWFVLRRMRTHARSVKPALATAGGPPSPDDAEFNRYRDAVERETEHLN